jgi:hypothetical protein
MPNAAGRSEGVQPAQTVLREAIRIASLRPECLAHARSRACDGARVAVRQQPVTTRIYLLYAEQLHLEE